MKDKQKVVKPREDRSGASIIGGKKSIYKTLESEELKES